MSRTKPQADHPSRLLALLVFLIGIGMLIFVFITALHLFQSPVPGLNLPMNAGTPAPPAANIGTALIVFVRELLLLGMMTIAGSILAGKGAHLYFGAAHPTSHIDSPPQVDHRATAEPANPESSHGA